ncbi:MAG: ROK family protein [Clostridiaceae bacterium]
MVRVGVDLGGTNIAVGLVNERHEMIAYTSVPTEAKRPAELIVADLCGAVDSVLQKAGICADDCDSIGVGAPGTCDVQRGIVIRSYSLSWANVALSAMMKERFSVPIRLDNDANCAALAEVKAGAAVGYENVVLVTLGTGIGTGIVIHGKVYSGLKGNGTEMGHVMLDMDGELCTCGRRGCWDAYASATALIVQAKRAAASRPESLLNRIEKMTGQSVFEAADQGDVTAKFVISQYCGYLSIGISNIVNALAPDMILVGGGISRQGDRILNPVREYVREFCFDTREDALPIIQVASMGNDAGIIGAAAL